jgi:hypothetical protein
MEEHSRDLPDLIFEFERWVMVEWGRQKLI